MTSRKKQSSPEHLKNERSNQFKNAEMHIWEFIHIKRKGVARIDSREIQNLKAIVSACIKNLKVYIDPKKYFRNGKITNDSLCEKINQEISNEIKIDLTDDERRWLSQFHNISYDVFDFSTDIKINSLDDIKSRLELLKSELASIKNANNDTIQRRIPSYLKEIERLSIGVGIVCRDGLKHYQNPEIDCVRSIKLGLTMFFIGADNLLNI